MPLATGSALSVPHAQSTTVRDGVTLRRIGVGTVTTLRAVISDLEIHGTPPIEADNVTVRDCGIIDGGGVHFGVVPILVDDYIAGVAIPFARYLDGRFSSIARSAASRSQPRTRALELSTLLGKIPYVAAKSAAQLRLSFSRSLERTETCYHLPPTAQGVGMVTPDQRMLQRAPKVPSFAAA